MTTRGLWTVAMATVAVAVVWVCPASGAPYNIHYQYDNASPGADTNWTTVGNWQARYEEPQGTWSGWGSATEYPGAVLPTHPYDAIFFDVPGIDNGPGAPLVIDSVIPNNIMGWTNLGVTGSAACAGHVEVAAGGQVFFDQLWVGRNNWSGGAEDFTCDGGIFDVTGGVVATREFLVGDNGVGQVRMTDGSVTVVGKFRIGNNNASNLGQASVLLEGGMLDVVTGNTGIAEAGVRGSNDVPVGGNIHLLDGLVLFNLSELTDVQAWLGDERITGEFGSTDRSAWELLADYSNGALRADFDGEVTDGRITLWAVAAAGDVIPEPATLSLLGLGALVALGRRRRR